MIQKEPRRNQYNLIEEYRYEKSVDRHKIEALAASHSNSDPLLNNTDHSLNNSGHSLNNSDPSISLFPRPFPSFCRLQYEKWGEGCFSNCK